MELYFNETKGLGPTYNSGTVFQLLFQCYFLFLLDWVNVWSLLCSLQESVERTGPCSFFFFGSQANAQFSFVAIRVDYVGIQCGCELSEVVYVRPVKIRSCLLSQGPHCQHSPSSRSSYVITQL